MQADLALVQIRKGESFAARMRGYPFRTVRRPWHPEYEIHLVNATSATFYIGDHVGAFAPGQFFMTGPNLPPNRISDTQPGKIVPLRWLLIQSVRPSSRRLRRPARDGNAAPAPGPLAPRHPV